MKRLSVLICCALLLLALAGCGNQSATTPQTVTPAASAEPTPEPTPAPTPAPTPEPTQPPTEWTITGESAEEILALADIPSLRQIDACGSTEYDALIKLRELLPDCEIRWEYTFEGVRYPSDAVRLHASSLDGLEDALRALPALEEVELLEAAPTLEELDHLSEQWPDIFWLCELDFHGMPLRTDILVYSSLQPIGFYRHDDSFYYPLLKYCTRLKALDLGHNAIGPSSMELIGKLTDLQVLILADDCIQDASPLANLKELIFLELFLDKDIEDFSFLCELHKMKDLNLCYCKHLTSLDFMEEMPELEFLMLKYTGVNPQYFIEQQEAHPGIRMVLYDGDIESTTSGWRGTTRNKMIRTTFSNWPNVIRYDRYNDLDFNFNGAIFPITYFVADK